MREVFYNVVEFITESLKGPGKGWGWFYDMTYYFRTTEGVTLMLNIVCLSIFTLVLLETIESIIKLVYFISNKKGANK